MQQKRVCKNCGLPEWYITYYGKLKIDEGGKCNFCNHYERFPNAYKIDYKSGKEKFNALVEKYRGKEEYDCIVLFSGGKDSCYSAYLAAKEYGLKTLALTLDTGFFDEATKRNIQVVTEQLGIEHRYLDADLNVIKEVYRNRLRNYGRFCGCVPLCILYAAPVIYQTKAPIVLFSGSFGQTIGNAESNSLIDRLSRASEILLKMKVSNGGITPISFAMKEMYEIMLLDIVVGDLSQNALEEMRKIFGYVNSLINQSEAQFVSPSSYFEWDIEKIFEAIEEYGWISPKDKGKYGHTSCIMEPIKGYLAYKQELINFDVIENAALVRMKVINHDEFINELECAGYIDKEPGILADFLKFINMTREELYDIISRKLVCRDGLPQINRKAIELLSISKSPEELTEDLYRVLKTKVTI